MLIRLRTVNLCLLMFSLTLNYLYLTGKIEGAFFNSQQQAASADYVSAMEVQLYDKKGKK